MLAASAFAFGPTGVAAVVGIVIAVMKWRSEPVVARLALIGLGLLLVATVVGVFGVPGTVDLAGWTVDDVRTFYIGIGVVVLVLTTIAWVLLLTALFVRLPQRAPAAAPEAAEADNAPTGRHTLLDDDGRPVVADTGAFLARPRSTPTGFAAAGAGVAGAGMAGAGAVGATAFGAGVFGEPRSPEAPPEGEESPTQALPVVGDAAEDTAPPVSLEKDPEQGAATRLDGQPTPAATDAEPEEDTATRAIPTPPRGATAEAGDDEERAAGAESVEAVEHDGDDTDHTDTDHTDAEHADADDSDEAVENGDEDGHEDEPDDVRTDDDTDTEDEADVAVAATPAVTGTPPATPAVTGTTPPAWRPTRSSEASGPLPTRTAGATGRVPAPFAASTAPSRVSTPAATVPGQSQGSTPPPSSPAAPKASSPASPTDPPRPPAARAASDHHPWFTPTGVDDPDDGSDDDAAVAEDVERSTPTRR